ncbi:MAG: serine hydrolase domain-containing protein [Polyangiales bacterium]
MGQPVASDLGYLIAGEALARVMGVGLHKLVASRVTEPLGIAAEMLYPGSLPLSKRSRLQRLMPPTERCHWRGKLVQGEVHDENAAAFGGVAGHAGMFATARALARFGREMLRILEGRSTFLPLPVLQSALSAVDGAPTCLGWQRIDGVQGVAGRRLSPQTFGGLGRTGTSLWCDPVRQLCVVLLTNRICPSRANVRINGFRPAFHDAIVAAFDLGQVLPQATQAQAG